MPIEGITSLYGLRAEGYTGAGALDSRRGLPGYGPQDDPYGQGEHGQWGDTAGPAYASPGWNGVLAREANLDVYTADFTLTDDSDYEGLGAGHTVSELDQTPYPVTVATGYAGRGQHRGYEETGAAPAEGYSSHAGPYPRTWLQAGRLRPEPGTELDDQWTEQEARRVTHEGGYGASRTGYTGPDEPQVTRRDVYYQSQGSSLLEAPGNQLRYAPGAGSGPAMRQGGGLTGGSGFDHAQGGGQPNAHGYGDAHVQNYRQQADGVPFNYNWLDASERPFIPKGQQTNMFMAQTYDSPDSPYGAMGDQTDYHDATFGPAMVESPASAYTAPPDPVLAQAPSGDDGEDVFAYG
ncbi:MAG TPA: hypothetical protein VKU39_11260 [Streptosporangiaceae bacterium]|nr:hypothetical protein [Streptosporangiaceae bacterium]